MKLNKLQLAAVKRTAMNVNSFVTKKSKILEQMNKMRLELEGLNSLIEGYEKPIREMTGGYSSSDIFEKQILTSPEGIKTTKYVLRHPETIVPNNSDLATTPNSEPSLSCCDSECEDTPINDFNNNINND